MLVDNTTNEKVFVRYLDSKANYHIPFLILVASSIWLHAVLAAPVPILAWRPTDLASIALNYYRNGLHFFYPQVNWGGNGPGYVEMEFPIIPFSIGLFYKLLGVRVWLTLVIPFLSGLGLVVVVYLFSRHHLGSLAGLTSGLFAAFSPTLTAMTSSLWPDPPMVFCGALAVYALMRWMEDDTWRFFMLGAFATSLAILLKLTALYLGIPILYICVLKYGRDAWKKAMVWLLAGLVLLPVIGWYWHAHTLYLKYHNTFGILSGGYSKFATSAILLDPTFYMHALLRIATYHLTPLVFALFIYGMIVPSRSHFLGILNVWVGAVVVYTFVAAQGVVDGHYQYLLPLVAPATVLAGIGLSTLAKRIGPYWVFSRIRVFPSVALTILCLSTAIAGSFLFQTRDRYATPAWENDRKTGLATAQVSSPGSLIIVVDAQMDAFSPERSMTPPNVFYFADRRGWYVSLAWLTEGLIERLRTFGAHYLVVTANTIPAFISSPSSGISYLRMMYETVLSSNDAIVFDLTRVRTGDMSGSTKHL